MNRKRLIAFALAALDIVSVASAQPYTVTFDIVYEKVVLLPGESQTISVVSSTSIKAGTEYTIQNTAFPALNGTKGVLRGLAFAYFDVANIDNGEHGDFTAFGVLDPWNFQGFKYVPGTLDGLGGVANIQAGQFQQLQIPDPPYAIPYELQEPAMLWQGTWTPKPGFFGEVAFTTETSDIGQGKSPAVMADTPLKQFWVADHWIAEYKPASFQVVPAPGGSAAMVSIVLLSGVASGARRRKRLIPF